MNYYYFKPLQVAKLATQPPGSPKLGGFYLLLSYSNIKSGCRSIVMMHSLLLLNLCDVRKDMF
jgi:hypothetical protein